MVIGQALELRTQTKASYLGPKTMPKHFPPIENFEKVEKMSFLTHKMLKNEPLKNLIELESKKINQ